WPPSMSVLSMVLGLTSYSNIKYVFAIAATRSLPKRVCRGCSYGRMYTKRVVVNMRFVPETTGLLAIYTREYT
ncbi:MAG: hypothetical protein SFV81_10480, partial [Pirellulaceae bacterium]|nr:hypothetical protein [Pirellulaceae bacterium]